MEVIDNISELRTHIKRLKKAEKSIGLVPTMGALHEGHLALVEQANECDIVVVSIFVNPLQFNNEHDLNNYPRTFESDLKFLEGKCAIIFAPSVAEFYPTSPKVAIDLGKEATLLEGKFRPGHFNGVGLVVAKLLNVVQPDVAYFGLKDLQQFTLVKQLIHDLSMQVSIVGCPIVREKSGLAMSSRNQRLSENGKIIASSIYKGLELAKKQFDQADTLEGTKRSVLNFYSSIEGLEIEYLELVNGSFSIQENYSDSVELAICVAGYVEGIRLIDNIYLRSEK